MIIKSIDVRVAPSAEAPGSDLIIAFRYSASAQEAATVRRMLVSGKEPPKESWGAIGYGSVKVPAGDRGSPVDPPVPEGRGQLCPTHGQPMIRSKCGLECTEHWVCVCTYGGH